MADGDRENLFYAGSTSVADRANRLFYERFGTFPLVPREFKQLTRSTIEKNLMLQETGDWDHARMGDSGRIWVAGCGAYQAIEVALRFPGHEVFATDLSAPALEFSAS